MAPASDTGRSELGRTIRHRRRDAGRTLVELAAATGLSHPFLSQVETGRAQPSIESLRRIADALGTTPQALFADAPATGARLVRSADAATLDVAGAAPGSVARVLLGGDVPVHLVELDGLPRQFQDRWQHDGFEAVYVVRGQVDVEVEGVLHELGEGDSLSYPAHLAHRVRERGRGRAKVLLTELPSSSSTPAPIHAAR